MTTTTCTHAPTQTRAFSPLAWVIHAIEVRRERKALATLTRAQLEDVGLSYSDAHTEATKPIWDVPNHWS